MLKRSFKRLFWRIGDVTELTGLDQQTLRNWEQEFKQLRPRREPSGVRTYRERDLKLVLLLSGLIVEDAQSIDEVRQFLDENKDELNDLLEDIDIEAISRAKDADDSDKVNTEDGDDGSNEDAEFDEEIEQTVESDDDTERTDVSEAENVDGSVEEVEESTDAVPDSQTTDEAVEPIATESESEIAGVVVEKTAEESATTVAESDKSVESDDEIESTDRTAEHTDHTGEPEDAPVIESIELDSEQPGEPEQPSESDVESVRSVYVAGDFTDVLPESEIAGVVAEKTTEEPAATVVESDDEITDAITDTITDAVDDPTEDSGIAENELGAESASKVDGGDLESDEGTVIADEVVSADATEEHPDQDVESDEETVVVDAHAENESTEESSADDDGPEADLAVQEHTGESELEIDVDDGETESTAEYPAIETDSESDTKLQDEADKTESEVVDEPLSDSFAEQTGERQSTENESEVEIVNVEAAEDRGEDSIAVDDEPEVEAVAQEDAEPLPRLDAPEPVSVESTGDEAATTEAIQDAIEPVDAEPASDARFALTFIDVTEPTATPPPSSTDPRFALAFTDVDDADIPQSQTPESLPTVAAAEPTAVSPAATGAVSDDAVLAAPATDEPPANDRFALQYVETGQDVSDERFTMLPVIADAEPTAVLRVLTRDMPDAVSDSGDPAVAVLATDEAPTDDRFALSYVSTEQNDDTERFSPLPAIDDAEPTAVLPVLARNMPEAVPDSDDAALDEPPTDDRFALSYVSTEQDNAESSYRRLAPVRFDEPKSVAGAYDPNPISEAELEKMLRPDDVRFALPYIAAIPIVEAEVATAVLNRIDETEPIAILEAENGPAEDTQAVAESTDEKFALSFVTSPTDAVDSEFRKAKASGEALTPLVVDEPNAVAHTDREPPAADESVQPSFEPLQPLNADEPSYVLPVESEPATVGTRLSDQAETELRSLRDEFTAIIRELGGENVVTAEVESPLGVLHVASDTDDTPEPSSDDSVEQLVEKTNLADTDMGDDQSPSTADAPVVDDGDSSSEVMDISEQDAGYEGIPENEVAEPDHTPQDSEIVDAIDSAETVGAEPIEYKRDPESDPDVPTTVDPTAEYDDEPVNETADTSEPIAHSGDEDNSESGNSNQKNDTMPHGEHSIGEAIEWFDEVMSELPSSDTLDNDTEPGDERPDPRNPLDEWHGILPTKLSARREEE
jgi:DNA-binding transcriptional MerR regulator